MYEKNQLLYNLITLLMEEEESDDSCSSSDNESDDEIVILLLASGCSQTETLTVDEVQSETLIPKYYFEDFRHYFHLSKTTFDLLLGTVKKSQVIPIFKSGKECIDPERHILITLWYLANTESVRNLADRFKVSESTVIVIVRRITKFFAENLKKVMVWWPKGKRLNDVKQKFLFYNVPDVLGIIQSTHIRIRKPKQNDSEYQNRQGFYSIILQAVMDPKMLFTDVYCQAPGSWNNTDVLLKSPLYDRVKTDPKEYFPNKEVIIGDKSYLTLDWLITPFSDNGYLSCPQKEFNEKLYSVIKEKCRAFGMLKGRFQKLQNLYITKLSMAPQIINSCVALHNLCLLSEDSSSDFYDSSVEEQILEISTYQCSDEIDKNRRLEIFKKCLNVTEI